MVTRRFVQTVAALASFAATSLTAAPNIVWIIADDLSPELGCYGYRGVHTPNIDRLAAQGTRFTAAFATSPVCSPSRSALITGRYQTSIGAHHHRSMDKQPLPDGVVPITEHMRAAGYQCVNLKGRGANSKTDYNFKPAKPVFDSSTLEGDRPFFLQVCLGEPHRRFKNKGEPGAPFSLPPHYPNHPTIRADWANYLADIKALDGKIGKLLSWLDSLENAGDTAVFFFGDHGRPHLWDKQWLYDGGIRVPLIVRWPGVVEAGKTDDRLISLLDVSKQTVYTACAAARIEMPGGFDGHAFLAEFAPCRDHIVAARDRCGDAYERVRCVRTHRFKYIRNFYPELPYWQTSRYKAVQYPALAVMKDLLSQGELTPSQARFFSDRKPAEELYDLASDPHESKNLAGDPNHSETLERLRATLDDWITDTADQAATPESLEFYDAAVEASSRHFKQFESDSWHERSEVVRKRMRERALRPE